QEGGRGDPFQAEVPALRAGGVHLREDRTARRKDFPAHRRDRGRLSQAFPDLGVESDPRARPRRTSTSLGEGQAAPFLLHDAAQNAADHNRAVFEYGRAAAFFVSKVSGESVSGWVGIGWVPDSSGASCSERDEEIEPFSRGDAEPRRGFGFFSP